MTAARTKYIRRCVVKWRTAIERLPLDSDEFHAIDRLARFCHGQADISPLMVVREVKRTAFWVLGIMKLRYGIVAGETTLFIKPTNLASDREKSAADATTITYKE
jgi:hypothetical protein